MKKGGDDLLRDILAELKAIRVTLEEQDANTRSQKAASAAYRQARADIASNVDPDVWASVLAKEQPSSRLGKFLARNV